MTNFRVSNWRKILKASEVRILIEFILCSLLSLNTFLLCAHSEESTREETANSVNAAAGRGEPLAGLSSTANDLALSGIAIFKRSPSLPLAIRSQHPFELIHLRPELRRAEFIPSGKLYVTFAPEWSNTLNRRSGHYIIDSETAALESSLFWGISDELTLSANLPLIYRGGGVADSPIESFHSLFGLPQGQRKRVGQSRFQIEGNTENGGIFSWDGEGFGVGTAEIRADLSLLKNINRSGAIFSSLGLPGIGSTQSQDSFDIAIGSVLTERFRTVDISVGAIYKFYGDTFESGVEYETHHGIGYFSGEYSFFDWLSAIATVSYESAVVKNIPFFPNYSVYLDLAARIRSGWGSEILLGIRENPGPDSGTTDITLGAQVALPIS